MRSQISIFSCPTPHFSSFLLPHAFYSFSLFFSFPPSRISIFPSRLCQVLEQFLEILDTRDDSSYIVVRKLLQTAICASSMESPKDVAKLLGVDASCLNAGDENDLSGAKADGVSSTTAKISPTVSQVANLYFSDTRLKYF